MSITTTQLKSYINENLNIMVVGPAGTGKTAMLKEACGELNLKIKYYNAATLDPFADLLGIPVPQPNTKVVEYYRPHDVDNAEVIFVDELNRASTQTTNAIFEMIQFRTINGEPLENLRCVVAAINPVEEGYDTNELDVALLDRFDVYLNAPPEANIPYFRKKYGDDYAKAGIDIFNNYQKDYNSKRRSNSNKPMGYLSPRRLDKLLEIFKKFPTHQTVSVVLPNDVILNAKMVADSLNIALGNIQPAPPKPKPNNDDIENRKLVNKQLKMPFPDTRSKRNAPDYLKAYEWTKTKNETALQNKMLNHLAGALNTHVGPQTIDKVWKNAVIDFNKTQEKTMMKGWSRQKISDYTSTIQTNLFLSKYPLIAKTNV